jgi:hypothetical protein
MTVERKPLLVVLACALLALGAARDASAQMMASSPEHADRPRRHQTAYMKSARTPGEELAKVETINMKFADGPDDHQRIGGPFMKMRQIEAMQKEKDAALQGACSRRPSSNLSSLACREKQVRRRSRRPGRAIEHTTAA